MWSISHEKAPRGPGTSARKSRFVCMRAFANECRVCMRSQFCSRDACTFKTRNRSHDWNVRLSIFSPFDLKLKFLLRFQLACLASSAIEKAGKKLVSPKPFDA
jgi:hypothetical protein